MMMMMNLSKKVELGFAIEDGLERIIVWKSGC